jgi:SAM-dependent methyltransferase
VVRSEQVPDRLMSQAEVADSMDWSAFYAVLLDAARFTPGQRVLDVGCGFGATTLYAATHVAPGGSVVGIDNSPEMVRRARQRLGATALDNVELLEGDAQTHPFEPGSFDVVISAFGLMFFDNPDAAFRNLRSAMRPGGLLTFTSWQDLSASDYFVLAAEAMAGHIGRPRVVPASGPGPFFLSDPERIERLLRRRGFEDVEIRAVTRPERVGRTLDEAVRVVTTIPLLHSMLVDADPRAAADAVAALTEALRPHAQPGGVMSSATVWLAAARRQAREER